MTVLEKVKFVMKKGLKRGSPLPARPHMRRQFSRDAIPVCGGSSQ
jgi:hypothetical protein